MLQSLFLFIFSKTTTTMANVKAWVSINLIGISILCLIIYSYVQTKVSVSQDAITSGKQDHQGTLSRSFTNQQNLEYLNLEGIKSVNGANNKEVIPFPKKRVNCILDKTEFWLNKTGFTTLVQQNRQGSDPEVVSVVSTIMDQPSENMLKRSNNLITTPQAQQVLTLTKKMKNGFFIECGALDGERSSNTVVLEVEHDWKGLLIEMDPFFYTQLLAKNRKSWSVNACLSPNKYVSYLNYSEDVSGRGQLLTNGLKGETKTSRRVPCFPLESFLLSLKRTKVDFFSLDVEGLELKVLQTIPFDKIDISLITVEHLHVVGGKENMKSFMESKGYVMYKQIDYEEPRVTLYAHDLFFVKQSYLDSIS